MPKIVRGDGISRRQAKKQPKVKGRRRKMMLQERSWAKKSGAVKVGRLEDLPADDPRRA